MERLYISDMGGREPVPALSAFSYIPANVIDRRKTQHARSGTLLGSGRVGRFGLVDPYSGFCPEGGFGITLNEDLARPSWGISVAGQASSKYAPCSCTLIFYFELRKHLRRGWGGATACWMLFWNDITGKRPHCMEELTGRAIYIQHLSAIRPDLRRKIIAGCRCWLWACLVWYLVAGQAGFARGAKWNYTHPWNKVDPAMTTGRMYLSRTL